MAFVGFSEKFHQAEQTDSFDTVFSQADGLKLSGVEIAATMFANLLEGRSVTPYVGAHTCCCRCPRKRINSRFEDNWRQLAKAITRLRERRVQGEASCTSVIITNARAASCGGETPRRWPSGSPGKVWNGSCTS